MIYGRSDATLNPGGVRIGTAEIYRQVEQLPEVVESLAVGQRWDGDERIVLFVRLAAGVTLDDELRERIAKRIRANTSPRHVPARIVQVADIPADEERQDRRAGRAQRDSRAGRHEPRGAGQSGGARSVPRSARAAVLSARGGWDMIARHASARTR